MANINLSTSHSSQYSVPGNRIAQSGMAVVAIIFLIIIAVTGGLELWKNNLNARVSAAEDEYSKKNLALVKNERGADIVDFQNRLLIADNIVASPNIASDVLKVVEDRLVSGVYLTSYEMNKTAKTLTLGCVADNYESVAKQLLSLKNSNYFVEVAVKDVSLSGEGKNIFSISIKLN